jgi:hypothetical protein
MEFPQFGKMNPARAPAGDNPLNRFRVAQPIVDDVATGKRRGLKRPVLKCAQAYFSSCRNIKWSWRQIARKTAGRALENRFSRDRPDIPETCFCA